MNVTVSTGITPLITKENNPMTSVTKPIGNDRSLSFPGQNTGTYWPSEPPQAALDGNFNTEYSNHGICNGHSPLQDECGIKTGF
ncbi:unnamed protein product [Adineta steineri]|uniref:Uncharacterized protein n=1 Tax=Adineta steineri TaxID=433720 RepID=A0A816FH92_9BILA|nr:unnamed protein product [Adineta steineri]CAF1661513.1 unnamed protein product [Adineta steineri]